MAFADASVEAEADFQKFDQEFPAKLRDAVTKATQKVIPFFKTAGTEAGKAFVSGVTNAFSRITTEARRIGAEAGRAFVSAAEAFTNNIDVGFKEAVGAGQRLGEQFRRGAEEFTEHIRVAFDANPAPIVQGRLAGFFYKLGAETFTRDIKVDFDVSHARELGALAGREFRAALEGRLAGLKLLPGLPGGRVPGTRTGATGGGGFFGSILGFLFTDFSLFKAILAALPLLGPLLARATLATFGFIGSLAPLKGLLAGLPTAIGLLATSLGTIALAGEAIGKTFKENLGPAFRTLKDRVGEIAVKGLDTDLKALAKTLAGPVSDGAELAAAGLNSLLRTTVQFFASAQGADTLKSLFEGTFLVFSSLNSALPAFLSGTSAVAVAVLPIFTQLANLLAFNTKRLGEFLSQAAASGRAFDWVQNAINTLGGLGAILINTGSILASIFRAATGVTGDLVASLADATAHFAGFLKSAEGTAILRTIFQTLQILAAPLHVTLVALGQAIGPLSQALAIVLNVIGELGPILGLLIAGLARGLLPIIQALDPLLQGLVEGLTAFLAPLAPILEQVGKLTAQAILPLAQALGELARQLGPSLGGLVGALGEALIPLFAALAPIVKPFADAIVQLTPALVGLVPPMTDLVIALTPLIVLLANFAVATVQLLTPLLVLATKLTILTDSNLAEVITGIARAFELLTPVITFASDSIALFGKFVSGQDVGKVGSSIGDGLGKAADKVREFGAGVIGFFKDLPGKIVDGIKALPGALANAFTEAIRFTFRTIGQQIGTIIAAFDIAGQILATLNNLRPQMLAFFGQLLSDIGTAIVDGFNASINFVTVTLPDQIGKGFQFLLDKGQEALTNLKNLVVDNADSIRASVVKFFTEDLPNGLKSAGPNLLKAGRDAISNLLRGLSDFGDKALNFIGDLGRKFKAYINDNVIGQLEKGINDALPGNLNIHIPRLAKGAFLTAPTLAVLAEAGPEVAIPLSDPNRARQLAQESGLTNLINVGSSPQTNVRVFIGERELTDMIRVETSSAMNDQADGLLNGPRWAGA